MKVLIFITRQLCYNSGRYFAQKIGKALQQYGCECEYCEIPEYAIPAAGTEIAQPASLNSNKKIDQSAEELLEQYINKKYDAVLDFNSKLPRLIMDDDSYYLDNIDAPFYNFILDHPLYHHTTLSCKLNNYHVFSIDDNHCKYVRKYYPWIKDASQINLGAEQVAERDISKKENNILFMGTYRNPDVYMQSILQSKDEDKCDMLSMIDKITGNDEITIENSINKEPKSLILNKYYLVEMYIRNFYRKKLIDTLVDNKFPIKIVGEWWDKYDKSDRIDLQKPVAFEQSLNIIAKSRILVDSSPFFKMGVHDRVYAGMANNTVVMTDSNKYRENILNGIAQMYHLNDIDDICMKADKLLNDRAYYENLVYNAHKEYEYNYTWNKVGERIIKHFLCE